MSTEAIGETTLNTVTFEATEREKSSAPGLAAEVAAQAHLNGVKDALMEVARLETSQVDRSSRPKATNSMLTTFKIMKIVMQTLRESSENSKEMNKLLKKEWKALSDQQSKKNEKSWGNANSNQWYMYAGQFANFSHMIAQGGVSMGLAGSADGSLVRAFNHLGGFNVPYVSGAMTAAGGYLGDAEKVKEGISTLKGLGGNLSSGLTQMGSSLTQAEQYQLGIKESKFQHEVQTHTSEYQNGTQQQTSDNQAVDNAADTAKQLIRVQGEILMGKAG